jgi:hypothetical protein
VALEPSQRSGDEVILRIGNHKIFYYHLDFYMQKVIFKLLRRETA